MLENSIVVGADYENDKLFTSHTFDEIGAREKDRGDFVDAILGGCQWFSNGNTYSLADALEYLHCISKGAELAERWAFLREHSDNDDWQDIAESFFRGELPVHYRMFVQAAWAYADKIIGEEKKYD